jgi:hypothetical protein
MGVCHNASMSFAACDPDSFYPLRSLVQGPFTDLAELPAIERFVRTVVLHDEIAMDAPPISYDPEGEREWTDEEMAAGGRAVIVSFAPVVDGFQFFTDMRRDWPVPEITLSPQLLDVAEQYANAGPGNVYFKAHLSYLKRMLGVVELGGSALVSSKFGQTAIRTAQRYPEELFHRLDQDWREFAEELSKDKIDLVVPPVLGIVLTRAARRDAIPSVICDLRAEWWLAREKVWSLLDELRNSSTVNQARELLAELVQASLLFSPKQENSSTNPIRILWEILAASAGGAATAALSGGAPAIGAVTGAVGHTARSITPLIREHGAMIFRRGALDLARRVQTATRDVEIGALPRLLSDQENKKLGFA